jgi:hypothetical protein
MLTKIEVVKIEYCGCDAEGTIELYIPQFKKKLIASYQGSDEQINKALPEDSAQDVLLYMWLATINKDCSTAQTIEQTGTIDSYEALGTYKGVVEIDGTKYHKVDSEFPIIIDEEFDTTVPYNVGDNVKVTGGFFVESLE